MLRAMIVSPSTHSQIVNVLLWVGQAMICGSLCIGEIMKLTMPIAKISQIFPWTGQVSKPFLRFIGVVDLAGGLGILLPEVTHIVPRLTVLAAIGCIALQALAIGFHVRRDEASQTPFNFFLLALCGFVLWGRW
jgi:hypothetical protein